MHTLITNKKISTVLGLMIAMVLSTFSLEVRKRELPADTSIVSTDEVTVKGQKVPYRVTVGTQPVYGEDGEADASLFYTYYERTDVRNNEILTDL
ncbi:MAG: hypothetical protein U5K71_14325 [Gracilimonas sp.]|nr:hypothetical protein [Gracilimonas sp.]